MQAIYVGVDNGVGGTIGVVDNVGNALMYMHTPTKEHLSYTKKFKRMQRIDHLELVQILGKLRDSSAGIRALLERPMVDPKRFVATASALRAWESTLIAFESWNIPVSVIDSKEWQKMLLPWGASGAGLKFASKEVGCRLFPTLKDIITKHGDADGLLIAEYARRTAK